MTVNLCDEHEACNIGSNAARIDIERMGSGPRDGFGPPAATSLAFSEPFGRRPTTRSRVISRSALLHYGRSRLGRRSRLISPSALHLRFAYIAPHYSQAKDVALMYVKSMARNGIVTSSK